MSIFEQQMAISDMQAYYDALELGNYEVSPIKTNDLSQIKLIASYNCNFANIIPSIWTLDGNGDPTDPRRQTRLSNLKELKPILTESNLQATSYYVGFGQYNHETRCFVGTDPKDATHLELNCFFDFFGKPCDCHEEVYFKGQVVRHEYDNPSGHKFDLQQRYIIQLPDSGWAWKYRIEASTRQNQALLKQYNELVEYRKIMPQNKKHVEMLERQGLFTSLNCTCDIGEYSYLVTNGQGAKRKFLYRPEQLAMLMDFLTV